MSTVIAVSNHKGGVGKTTSTVNLGAGLAKMKKRVLLIDLDPQANLTDTFKVPGDSKTIYDSLRGEDSLSPVEITKYLSVVPSSIDLSGAEVELSSEVGGQMVLSELIESIKPNYEYIFIDCPPSLGLLTINALTAADKVFIPIQAHYLALKGLTKLIAVVEKIKKRLNPKLEIGGVFVTQYNRRTVLNRDVFNSISSHFGDKAFKTKIRNNISLAEAPSATGDIFSYAASSNGAQDYMLLCKEFIKKAA